MQVVTVGFEGWHGVGTQLEGAPDNSNIRICLPQFTYGRLRQPAEWSNVVRKHFELYGFHNLTLNSGTRAFQRNVRKCRG